MKTLKDLAKKYSVLFLVIIILSTVAGAHFWSVNLKDVHTTTVFLSLAAKDVNALDKGKSVFYQNIEAADQFAESMQGWFTNPVFLVKTNSDSQGAIGHSGFSVHKQEKQNLLVTFKTRSENESKRTVAALKSTLENYLKQYNQVSATNFSIAIFDSTYNPETTGLITIILLSLIFGLILSLFLSAIHFNYLKEC